MNTPDQVYTLLRDALLKARADGLRIIAGDFGNGKTCCCAITAYFRKEIDNDLAKVSDDLGLPSESDAWALINGFDNDEMSTLSPFYAVGQKLRAEFIEQKGEA